MFELVSLYKSRSHGSSHLGLFYEKCFVLKFLQNSHEKISTAISFFSKKLTKRGKKERL